MQSMTADQRIATSAAIRARGRISLGVEGMSGITRRRRVHESGSLRVRFPGPPAGELEAVTGQHRRRADRRRRVRYRRLGRRECAAGGHQHGGRKNLSKPWAARDRRRQDQRCGRRTLTWLPQETILFDKAALHRRIEVDLADDARLVLVEPLVFGRTGMGESVRNGELHDRWRVRRNGRLIYAEGTRLDGHISANARRDRGRERRRGRRDRADRSR